MSFEVRFTVEAEDDLVRLVDFLLDRAQTLEDLASAGEVELEIRNLTSSQLGRTPYSFRKAGLDPHRRELIIPSGRTGYIALYEIVPPDLVLVIAVRHQLEEDYH